MHLAERVQAHAHSIAEKTLYRTTSGSHLRSRLAPRGRRPRLHGGPPRRPAIPGAHRARPRPVRHPARRRRPRGHRRGPQQQRPAVLHRRRLARRRVPRGARPRPRRAAVVRLHVADAAGHRQPRAVHGPQGRRRARPRHRRGDARRVRPGRADGRRGAGVRRRARPRRHGAAGGRHALPHGRARRTSRRPAGGVRRRGPAGRRPHGPRRHDARRARRVPARRAAVARGPASPPAEPVPRCPTWPMSAGSRSRASPWRWRRPAATTSSWSARPAPARRCWPRACPGCSRRSPTGRRSRPPASTRRPGWGCRRAGWSAKPPFRAPHHGASSVALVGGGSATMRPGEISRRAQRGAVPRRAGRVRPDVLDALRQPLEEGVVRVARAVARSRSRRVPAGRGDEPVPVRRRRPARWVSVQRCAPGALPAPAVRPAARSLRPARRGHAPSVSDLMGTDRTSRRRRCASACWRCARGPPSGASRPTPPSPPTDSMTSRRSHPDAADLLADALKSGRLSARGLHRVRRVARTVADLQRGTRARRRRPPPHVAIALSLPRRRRRRDARRLGPSPHDARRARALRPRTRPPGSSPCIPGRPRRYPECLGADLDPPSLLVRAGRLRRPRRDPGRDRRHTPVHRRRRRDRRRARSRAHRGGDHGGLGSRPRHRRRRPPRRARRGWPPGRRGRERARRGVPRPAPRPVGAGARRRACSSARRRSARARRVAVPGPQPHHRRAGAPRGRGRVPRGRWLAAHGEGGRRPRHRGDGRPGLGPQPGVGGTNR